MTFCWGLFQRAFFIFSLLVISTLNYTEATAAQLTLTWTDNSTNESGFKIERKTDTAGIYAQVATVGVNATSYSDVNLATGTTYCYQVRAFNSAEISAPSNEACSTTAGQDPNSTASPGNMIPQKKWRVKFVDSQEPPEWSGALAIDGNVNTFWHTQWRSSAPPPPHEIQIDLGGVYTITK